MCLLQCCSDREPMKDLLRCCLRALENDLVQLLPCYSRREAGKLLTLY